MDPFSLPPIGSQHPEIRRVKHGRMLVAEGLWAHSLLLELDAPVETFLWCPESGYSPQARRVAAAIAARAAKAYQISQRLLERLCERDRPDGMISLVPVPVWRPADVVLGEDALVLVADGIEIPGNLGTLLRTIDACGAACLVLTNRRTRLSHQKVFRGSRGMNLKVPVLEFVSVAEASEWLCRNDFDVHLATVNPDAIAYHDTHFTGRTAFVVGNERYGIAPEWYDLGFGQVMVPMRGRADSLNVAVSAAILLYAAARPSRSRIQAVTNASSFHAS